MKNIPALIAALVVALVVAVVALVAAVAPANAKDTNWPCHGCIVQKAPSARSTITGW